LEIGVSRKEHKGINKKHKEYYWKFGIEKKYSFEIKCKRWI